MLRVGRGLYRWMDAEGSSHEGLSAVGLRAPNAVVCLLSALSFHDIGTQDPAKVWIGVETGKWKPTSVGGPVRVVHFSRKGMTYGVATHEIAGVKVRITNPARTIVDCFRYRLKVGLDVALEALEDALRRQVVTRDALMRTAEVFRQARVMRPYLEAYSR